MLFKGFDFFRRYDHTQFDREISINKNKTKQKVNNIKTAMISGIYYFCNKDKKAEADKMHKHTIKQTVIVKVRKQNIKEIYNSNVSSSTYTYCTYVQKKENNSNKNEIGKRRIKSSKNKTNIKNKK